MDYETMPEWRFRLEMFVLQLIMPLLTPERRGHLEAYLANEAQEMRRTAEALLNTARRMEKKGGDEDAGK